MIIRLAKAGMNVARLNLSHGNMKMHTARIRLIRSVSEELNTPIGILADLPGPKIRVGKVSPEPLNLRKGGQVTLTARRVVGNQNLLTIIQPSILKQLDVQDSVFLADGTIKLIVQEKKDSEVICRVIRGGALFSGKGVNIPGKRLGLRALTSNDIQLLEFALRNEVDFLGLSFTMTRNDVARAKRMVKKTNSHAWVIAKIERRQAIENFDEIVKEADGIMVARGDLGVEMEIEDVPVIQKKIIARANESGKPVITATQMLESMVNNPTPTRAEVTDIANAIIDGTDAVMLSEETAVGNYPIEAVYVMKKVAAAIEKSLPYEGIFESRRKLLGTAIQDSISFSACEVAHKLGASCIVAHTRTGLTAHRVSKFRSSVPIIALTHQIPVMNRLSLLWGVYPYQVRRLRTTAEIFATAKRTAQISRIGLKKDRIVVVCGDPSTQGGTTDLLRVQAV
jgi:pyruvate kinase